MELGKQQHIFAGSDYRFGIVTVAIYGFQTLGDAHVVNMTPDEALKLAEDLSKQATLIKGEKQS